MMTIRFILHTQYFMLNLWAKTLNRILNSLLNLFVRTETGLFSRCACHLYNFKSFFINSWLLMQTGTVAIMAVTAAYHDQEGVQETRLLILVLYDVAYLSFETGVSHGV